MTTPTLVVGAQRSGTTALAGVLDAAFEAVGGLFTINGKLPYLLHRWCTAADLAGRHFRSDEVVHALHRRTPLGSRAAAWMLRVEAVLREAAADVAAGNVADPVELRREIVRRSYAGPTRYGEKYNEYLLEPDALIETVPDGHLVLLVRHPMDVAASMMRWTGDRPWRPRNVADALAKWVAWHEPWLANPATEDPYRCTVLEYQHLCAGADLRRLADALQLDLEPHATPLVARPSVRHPRLPASVRAVWDELLERRLA